MESKTLTTILALLLVVVAIFTFIRFTQQYGLTGAAVAQTNLTVNATCGIALNVTDYPGLAFPTLNPNTTHNANNISVNFSNTGNFQQNVSINASRFFANATGSESFLQCNQTRYQNWSSSLLDWESIGASGQGICQGSTLATINRVQENQSFVGAGGGSRADNNTTFKINIPAGTPAGSPYHQNITYYAEC